MTDYLFRLDRPPLTKKTSQSIGRRGDGKPFVMSSPAQKGYQKFAAQVLYLQGLKQGLSVPLTQCVQVTATFWLDADRPTDLTNLEQMLGDCLQSAGIIDNDALICSWDGSRKGVSYRQPRTELVVRTYDGPSLREGEPKTPPRKKG